MFGGRRAPAHSLADTLGRGFVDGVGGATATNRVTVCPCNTVTPSPGREDSTSPGGSESSTIRSTFTSRPSVCSLTVASASELPRNGGIATSPGAALVGASEDGAADDGAGALDGAADGGAADAGLDDSTPPGAFLPSAVAR